MCFKEILSARMGIYEIKQVSTACAGTLNNGNKEELYKLIRNEDKRIGYNALWVFTHFNAEDLRWLEPKTDELIDILLVESHEGKRRLLLKLLSTQSVNPENIRTDYLDFCMSRINSTEPYAIRAHCIREAFKMCRHFPELIGELSAELEIMEYAELSAGLLSVLRHTKRNIARLTR